MISISPVYPMRLSYTYFALESEDEDEEDEGLYQPRISFRELILLITHALISNS